MYTEDKLEKPNYFIKVEEGGLIYVECLLRARCFYIFYLIHNDPREELLRCSFYRRANCGSGKFKQRPQETWTVCSRAESPKWFGSKSRT